MHPWISHIHPSVRAALTAWLIARALHWLVRLKTGAALPPDLSAFEGGTPLWGALHHIATMIGAWGPWLLAGLGELSLLVACVSVYHFCRKDTLPQTAERAAWLFAFSPLMAGLVPASAYTLAVGGALAALAAAIHARHVLGAVSITAAIALRPELALLAPAVAWLGWRSRQPGRTPVWGPWLLGLAPIAAVTLTIFTSFLTAGIGGVSMRTLHQDLWREGLVFAGWGDVVWGLGALAVCVAAARYARRTPKVWWAITLPCLAWPILHTHPGVAAPMVLCAAPVWAYASKLCEEPGLERVVLTGSLGLGMLLSLG